MYADRIDRLMMQFHQIVFPADQWPLLLLQRYGLKGQRECSFKLEVGSGLIANRYVLGVARERIPTSTWVSLLGDLLPADWGVALRKQLDQHFQQATTVYLGFEQGPSGANLRLYFEFWDSVVLRLQNAPAEQIQRWQSSDPPLWTLMVGYKWPITAPAQLQISNYQVRPVLDADNILRRARLQLLQTSTDEEEPSVTAVLNLLVRILDSDTSFLPVYMEVSELGSLRRSFDLAVHRYGLRVSDVASEIQNVISSLLGPGVALQDALPRGSLHPWITHVSAGLSRRGRPYACIYYDDEDQ